ncbi:hypothetical protein, partial [Providencia huaxiensis]|uniref:hypothetical protein n=1 Tax=Providencia huaxiensis TaxID=2027290 RepID=UPI0034E47338
SDRDVSVGSFRVIVVISATGIVRIRHGSTSYLIDLKIDQTDMKTPLNEWRLLRSINRAYRNNCHY